MNDKYILYLYSAAAFHQEVLPAINNSDFVIRLASEQFEFEDDVWLDLEVIENYWYLNWEQDRYQLKQDEFLKVRSGHGDVLSLITRVEPAISWCGRKYGLPKCQPITIGSSADSLIYYDAFRLISASHAVISFVGTGYLLTDKGKNGVYINGRRLAGQKMLCFGDCIDLFGLRMVFLQDALAVLGHGSSEATVRVLLRPYDGSPVSDSMVAKETAVYFRRGPGSGLSGLMENGAARLGGGIAIGAAGGETAVGAAGGEIAIEAPAARHDPDRQPLLLTMGPAFTLAFPMIIAVLAGSGSGGLSGNFLYMGLFVTVGTALLGIFWGIMNWMYQKKSRQWEEKRRRIVYRNYLEEVEAYIDQVHREERRRLLERYPVCSQPLIWEEIKKRLWSRNTVQEDFLCQRLGLGEILFSVRIIVAKQAVAMVRDELKEEPERIKRKYERLKEVPVCTDMCRNALVGLAGGQHKTGSVQTAMSILLQIAVNNCYTDVKVVLLYHEENGRMNELAAVAKWLPHIWSDDRTMRYLAGNRAEAGEVFNALSEICRRRMKKHYVIFLENQDLLEGEGFSRYIFAKREGLRLTTVFLEEAGEDMPNECNYLIDAVCFLFGVCEVVHTDNLRLRYFKKVCRYAAHELARGLSGIRVRENAAEGEISSCVPLLSLFTSQKTEDMGITGRWRKSRIYESIRVPIGRKAGNRLLYLDIHEKYHGPHGLIAGTTGSGKSELLQTYLLSLAIHFPPAAVAFFIIDYKGGGMGNLLAELPHTVGVVSNLSGNQIRRALISIKSESYKRQCQFQKCGINHIDHYTAAYENRKVSECVPHLFVIVDEFAELKREEPEFIQELVSVAQVGRSLGIHLILSTQKPAGVVDDLIWSNARFRLCLRVQDRQDSMDMLHRPDAAELTGTGRCFLQVGNDEVFELFQAAFGGEAYIEDSEVDRTAGRMLTRTGRPAFNPEPAAGTGMTQAGKVIDFLKCLGKEAGCEKGNKMWMPLLPAKLSLEEVRSSGGRLLATVGLCDDPAKQRQFPLTVDLCRQGNILICGGPAAGKSTLLQTLLYSLMKNCTPVEAVFYMIDCSSRMLFPFRDMPHVAGAAGEEPDKWERIFFRLRQELCERKKRLAGGSFLHRFKRAEKQKAAEAVGRKKEEELSAAVLVIDNYAGFRMQSKEKYDDIVTQLAAEGSNNGIYLIFTASGLGMSEVPDRLAGNFGGRLCLAMGDDYQYGEVLRISRPGVYPEGMKDRGIVSVRGEEGVLEFQTALVYGEENDFIRSGKIAKEALDIRRRSPYAAEPVPEIPEVPDWDFFVKSVAERAEEDKMVPVGYEQESGNIYDIQLLSSYCFLIAGRKKSGKSNLLNIICRMGKASKTVYIDFLDKAGRQIPENSRFTKLIFISTEEELYSWLGELTREMWQRYQADGKNDYSRIFVLIDDLSDFLGRVYRPGAGIEAKGKLLEEIWEKGRGADMNFIGLRHGTKIRERKQPHIRASRYLPDMEADFILAETRPCSGFFLLMIYLMPSRIRQRSRGLP